MIDHPFDQVARRRAGAARAASDVLRDGGRGRRRSSAASSTGSTRPARPTTRSSCSRPITASCSATTGCVQKLGWFDTAFHVPLIVRDPRAEFDATRGTSVDAFTEHVDVHADDLRAARHRRAAAVRRSPAHRRGSKARRRSTGATRSTTSSTSAIPTAACSKRRSASRWRSARSRCSATTTASTCSSRGHHAFPPIFFDLDNDPAQLVNLAADPAYAPQGARLRAAHARLAHAPHRTHAHRHEAHRNTPAWSSAAPTASADALHELASETPDKRSFLTPVRTAEPELNVHPSSPIRGDPTSTMDGAVTRGVGRTSGITHAHRTGRTPRLSSRSSSSARWPSPAAAAQGAPDANFGSHGSVLTGWPASTAAALDALQIPGGKIVTFGASGDTGEQIDVTRYNANGSVDSAFGVGRAHGRLDHRLRDHGVPEEAPPPVRRQVRGRRRGDGPEHRPCHRPDPFHDRRRARHHVRHRWPHGVRRSRRVHRDRRDAAGRRKHRGVR